jgi:site-specific recombinase XerD
MTQEEKLLQELERQAFSKKTKQIYFVWYKKLCAYYKDIKPEDLTELQIKEFLTFLLERRRLSNSAIHQARYALHFIYNSFFIKAYDIKSFPLYPRQRAVPEILSQEDIYSLFSSMKDLRDRAIIGLIYSAGLDIGESVKLRITDVDFSTKFINVRKTQNRLARRMILSDYVARDLKQHIVLAKPQKYLFEGKTKSVHISTDYVRKKFNRAILAAGIQKKITIRCLRYSFIKHLEFQGIPLRSILLEQFCLRPRILHLYSEIEPSNIVVDHSPLDPIMQGLLKPSEDDFPSSPYVSLVRIDELRNFRLDEFDLLKLIQLCTELNSALSQKAPISIALLVRAIIDHVPPIFGKSNFSEVANNYSGTQSFSESMKHLDKSLRKVADSHIHGQIRRKEILPTFNQVDFRSDLDVLLGEIVRLLKALCQLTSGSS